MLLVLEPGTRYNPAVLAPWARYNPMHGPRVSMLGTIQHEHLEPVLGQTWYAWSMFHMLDQTWCTKSSCGVTRTQLQSPIWHAVGKGAFPWVWKFGNREWREEEAVMVLSAMSPPISPIFWTHGEAFSSYTEHLLQACTIKHAVLLCAGYLLNQK